MRNSHIALTIIALFFTQSSFANMMSEDNGPCKEVAKACVKGGYLHKGDEGKGFWFDCMKPVLLNKTVKNVTVDASVVSSCRQAKIEKMQTELQDLKDVK